MLLQQEFTVSLQNGVFTGQVPDLNSEIAISHANISELHDVHGTEQKLAITVLPPQSPCKYTLGRTVTGLREKGSQLAQRVKKQQMNRSFYWNLPGCCLLVSWYQASSTPMEIFPYLASVLELCMKSKCNTL